MPRSGARHTTVSDKVRIALCAHKKKHPSLTQNELKEWLPVRHLLQRSHELLPKANGVNLSGKRRRTVKHPQMEQALAEWFMANQDQVNMSGWSAQGECGKTFGSLLSGPRSVRILKRMA
ncbi:MAG: hypothetical protein BJ554DRAFT_6824 [Olpidium bornovanus]|uniref:Uncharacterized protein n=1 Tax=Olpidium bornovanus TaxID=278681 RepID=A0A8H8A218_9FUNG|nr:MAG: hypothetical protein BJ554DRAFT_6824 [Olpidium bornovanus]